MYDIIGDVHGHADKLKALLDKLEYRKIDGVYRHPSRKVIFLGDFIDSGNQNREVLEIAQAMTGADTALAVMGNHEFNAIAYATIDPDDPTRHLRPRNEKNNRQHGKFLAEFEADSVDHKACIEWFKQLPLFLDLPGLRAIHACWDQASMRAIAERLAPSNTLSSDLLISASRRGSDAYHAVETLLKGPELDLPSPHSFFDKYDHERAEVRIKWWGDHRSKQFHELVLGPPDAIKVARDIETPTEWPVEPYPETAPPAFVGHYWREGTPTPYSHNVACLDYSVARGGKLVAYRWDSEQQLCASKMVWV